MRNSTPTTGLFTRALVGVGAATALVGASVLGMSGIAGADGVADLPMTDLGSANLGFDSGTINQPGAVDLFGSAAPQPAAGEGGACLLVAAGGIKGLLFGIDEDSPNGYCAYPGLLDAGGSSGMLGSSGMQPAAGMVGRHEASILDPFSLNNWLRDPGGMYAEFGGSLGSSTWQSAGD